MELKNGFKSEKETVNNLTEFYFSCTRNTLGKFMVELQSKIDKC